MARTDSSAVLPSHLAYISTTLKGATRTMPEEQRLLANRLLRALPARMDARRQRGTDSRGVHRP